MPVPSPTTPPQTSCGSPQTMSWNDLKKEYVYLKMAQHTLRSEEEKLNDKIESLREASVRLQQSAEVEEEHVANQLFRRLDGAERDVRKLQILLREEEGSVGEMTDQILEIREQQGTIEQQLEQQQEYLMSQLQQKLLDLANRKAGAERQLIGERQRYLDLLARRLALIRRRYSRGEEEEGTPEEVVEGVRTTVRATSPDSCASEPGSSSIDMMPMPQFMSTSEQDQSVAPVSEGISGTHSHPHGGPLRCAESSSLTVPSPSSPSEHAQVIRLEQRLNRLLAEHVRAAQASTETEQRCAELVKKLKEIQTATFLDRARAVKMREDLHNARERLRALRNSTAGRETGEDGARGGDQLTLSPSVLSQHIRDRTIELLSVAPAPSTP